VADPGLGTINAVRLSCSALPAHGIVVVLNRFDPADALHVANRSWLTDRDGFDVVSRPSQLTALIVERNGMAGALGSGVVQHPRR
jgi:hypothetical protein